jgi:hypothetical protein
MSKMVYANGPLKTDRFVQFLNGMVLGCPVPAEIDNSNNGLVRYLNVQYIRKVSERKKLGKIGQWEPHFVSLRTTVLNHLPVH